jgi:hypothetical protein
MCSDFPLPVSDHPSFERGFVQKNHIFKRDVMGIPVGYSLLG